MTDSLREPESRIYGVEVRLKSFEELTWADGESRRVDIVPGDPLVVQYVEPSTYHHTGDDFVITVVFTAPLSEVIYARRTSWPKT